jgi:hypothetical protein
MTMLDVNTDQAGAALPQFEPLVSQDRPDVEVSRGKVYRAISLVRLSQEKLQVYAGNTGEPCDAYSAGDLETALGIALALLDEVTEEFEDFTERAPAVDQAVAHG